jgi:hypothetical protein
VNQPLSKSIVGEPPQIFASPFKLTYFADIGEVHEKVWVIDDLIGADESSVWYGYPGCGKSVLAGDAGAHVAAGLPWFGRPVQQGAVLYIAAERAGLVKRRLAAWRKHHNVDGIPLAVLEGVFDLCGPDHQAEAVVRAGHELARHSESRIVWVIIDTKAQVLAAGDPNSDRDIAAFMANTNLIRAGLGGPHITIVDHVPHSSPERMKGSGTLAGAVDGSFLIRKEGRLRSLTTGSKAPNDGPEDVEIRFDLQSVVLGVTALGKETTAPVVVPVDANAPGVAPSRTRSLTGPAQKIVAAFGRLLDADRSCPAPAVPGVRPGTRAVTLADLREMAFSLGIFAVPEPTDPEGRRKWRNGRNQAWNRGIEAVTKANALRLENDFVWNPSVTPVTNGDN